MKISKLKHSKNYIKVLPMSAPRVPLSQDEIVSNKKESLGNSLYELVFKESGRQDSNLRPSAPKEPAQ